MYEPESFLRSIFKKQYKLFRDVRSNSYNLNIVGWRHKATALNKFNDTLAVYWYTDGKWDYRLWSVTTFPGIPWLLNPINKEGTAVLVPGQYRNCYELGEYKGYKALKQVGKVKVFRDKNRDGIIDLNPGSIQEGLFGIHIHKAGAWSRVVGTSSAGCQVFQREEDFNEFIEMCEVSALNFGNSFTYTLLEI